MMCTPIELHFRRGHVVITFNEHIFVDSLLLGSGRQFIVGPQGLEKMVSVRIA